MQPVQRPILELIQNLFRSKPEDKPNVVVIGYGWGGSAFANAIDERQYNISVISKRTVRLNQPYMISEFEPSISLSPRLEVFQDEATSIDFDKHQVVCQKAIYPYDYLVVAAGSEPNDFGIDGVNTHCLMFKTEKDLEILKSKLSSVTDVTVIGAGPTGIELALKLQSLGKTVTIVEASPQILPGFSDQMKQALLSHLEAKHVTLNLGCKINKITGSAYNTDKASIPYQGLLIWTAGQKPVKFVLPPLTRPNALLSAYPNVYAIGDCIQGHGPPTAQNAKQQGLYLANNFNKRFENVEPYKFYEKGRIIDTPDCIYVEYRGHLLTLPAIFRFIIKTITE